MDEDEVKAEILSNPTQSDADFRWSGDCFDCFVRAGNSNGEVVERLAPDDETFLFVLLRMSKPPHGHGGTKCRISSKSDARYGMVYLEKQMPWVAYHQFRPWYEAVSEDAQISLEHTKILQKKSVERDRDSILTQFSPEQPRTWQHAFNPALVEIQCYGG